MWLQIEDSPPSSNQFDFRSRTRPWPIRVLSTRWSFVTQKDSVVRAALFQATAHALHLNGEPAIAQALLEFLIISGRPDGQHPVHLESRASGGYSPVIIEPSIVRCRKCGRAIVHVE